MKCQHTQEHTETSASQPARGKATPSAQPLGARTSSTSTSGRKKTEQKALSRLVPIIYEKPILPNRSNWETRNKRHVICPLCRQVRTVEHVAMRLPQQSEVFECKGTGCGNYSWDEQPPVLHVRI
jgi:hypothetical protein